MENKRSQIGAFSRIQVIAVISVVLLLGVSASQIVSFISDRNDQLNTVATGSTPTDHSNVPANNTSSSVFASLDLTSSRSVSDPFAPSTLSDSLAHTLAANYTYLQQQGTYSTSTGTDVGTAIGSGAHANISYPTYTTEQISTDKDISYARMLKYRSDLQISLKPLMTNTESELALLDKYYATKDISYLTRLSRAAKNYKLAATQSAVVVVPADAVLYQIGILDAMQQFGATLDEMATNKDDAVAEVVLLKTYTTSEQDMINSFNALYNYYRSKSV